MRAPGPLSDGGVGVDESDDVRAGVSSPHAASSGATISAARILGPCIVPRISNGHAGRALDHAGDVIPRRRALCSGVFRPVRLEAETRTRDVRIASNRDTKVVVAR
jgi:hypothetical protein